MTHVVQSAIPTVVEKEPLPIAVLDPYAIMNIDNLIDWTRSQLNKAMNDFDNWLVQNPDGVTTDNITFRARRQEIKLLKHQNAPGCEILTVIVYH